MCMFQLWHQEQHAVGTHRSGLAFVPPPPPPLVQDAGFRFAFDPVRCKFKPTQQTLQVCEESGLDLAQDIRKKKKRNERVAAEKLSGAAAGLAGWRAGLVWWRHPVAIGVVVF